LNRRYQQPGWGIMKKPKVRMKFEWGSDRV
jgi:hypothetical protein